MQDQTKALLSSQSWFPKILCPPYWEISRHKHIMTGRDESSLKSSVANRIFPLWMSLPQLRGGYLSCPLCSVLTKTSDQHRWDFPTMLKGKVPFVPAHRQMDRLFERLCSCLIFQFNKVRGGICGMGSQLQIQLLPERPLSVTESNSLPVTEPNSCLNRSKLIY